MTRARHRVTLLAALALAGCYQAHAPRDAGGGAGAGAHAPAWGGGGRGGPAGAGGNLDSEVDAGTGAAADAGADAGADLDPLLERADPVDGCTNRPGQWIALHGSHIHWQASARVRYLATGAEATMSPSDRDAAGLPLLEWVGLAELRVVVDAAGPWEPSVAPGRALPSGRYLASVLNPDGAASNEVQINLQWCD